TAMHNLDHAQTLAVVLPALLTHQHDQKRAKLLQYARRVWNLPTPEPSNEIINDDEIIDAAIAATKNFFEKMGVPTTLNGYGVKSSSIPELVNNFARHNSLPIGEHNDITAEAAAKILQLAV
ncbi:MAG: iron-containing alcohol dehydrogenase, partial [Moraxellaceae bacterium]